MYTEEKFEDEEDIRERAKELMGHGRGHERSHSDSEAALLDLILLAKQHGELYPVMVEILNHYGQILQRDINMYDHLTLLGCVLILIYIYRQLKADLFNIMDRFVEQAAMLDDL